jgi:[FeFe] hydrogenase H-cluster maturation GTPase HydF
MAKGKDLKPHIGIFGRRNHGKSSFINAIVGQDVAIVSNHAGTTTDPVKKSVEIFGVGPAIMIDTAGIDDKGDLGQLRVKKSLEVIKNIDLAILLIAQNCFDDEEINLLKHFKRFEIPTLIIHNKSDIEEVRFETREKIKQFSAAEVIEYSAIGEIDSTEIIDAIKRSIPETVYQKPSLFHGIVKPKDLVLLVTPIDSEAPDGRMILPQVMAWRDVLDHDAICMSVKESELVDFMKLGIKPSLVVTDSQVFDYVASVIPEEMPLTSFSILFARLKGEFEIYIEGTRQIEKLKDGDKILMLESCTHQLSCDDIGRYKIPKWLKSYTKKELQFEFISGLNKELEDLSDYAMVIQCGGCVATRKQIVNKIKMVSEKHAQITNYGMVIAYINGIFDRVIQPFTND